MYTSLPLLTWKAHTPGVPIFVVEVMLMMLGVFEPSTVTKLTISPALSPTVAGLPPKPHDKNA